MNNIRKFFVYAILCAAVSGHACKAGDDAACMMVFKEYKELLQKTEKENEALKQKNAALEAAASSERDKNALIAAKKGFLKCMNDLHPTELQESLVPWKCKHWAADFVAIAGQDALKALINDARFINNIK